MKIFHRSVGLIVLAIIIVMGGQSVLASSCNTSDLKIARLGQRGAHVTALQECLMSRGYSIPRGASGYFGTQTAKALKLFYKSELGINNSGLSFGTKGFKYLSGAGIDKPNNSQNQHKSTNGSAVGLRLIKSQSDLQKYIEESRQFAPYYGGVGGELFQVAAVDVAESAPTIAPSPQFKASSGSSDGVPSRVSTTNVQVAGIDEPDIVKTDGTTIYFSREPQYYYATPKIACFTDPCPNYQPPTESSGGTTAIKGFPLASLGISSASIPEHGEMLLVKDKNMLVIMNYNSIVAYDIGNPAKPVKKWTTKLADNSSITTARLMNNRIYLVASTYLSQDTPCPIIPLTTGERAISIPCNRIWAPQSVIPVSQTYTVLDIDPVTGVERDTLTFVGDSNGTTVSMFGENIYIAYRVQSGVADVQLEFYKTQISSMISSSAQSKINTIAGYDITTHSKLSEIQRVIENDVSQSSSDKLKLRNNINNKLSEYLDTHKRSTDTTTIVRIDRDTLNSVATGSIPGHLLNQFSMDEYNGNLRVATTVGETWSGKSVNDVYVLGSDLKTRGSILDMGVTERIYSARFIGDRGYIVTFRQTDPFYVLDLSQPTNPRMVGELKIPGYSAYLEPIDSHRVLGVGREGGQVKLSLFNVANPAKPIEESKYLLDEGWTEIESNHHAFLHDAKHKVFFIPGSSGGYVFSYSSGTIEMKSAVKIDSVKRALFIDDYLYIVARDSMSVIDENTWKEVATLKFE